MVFFSTVLSFFGFGVGVTMGLVIGYFLFVYFQPTDVKHPVIRPIVELDTKSLERMLPEIPHWVKNPDFDRIDWLNKFVEHMWPYLDKAICRTAKEIAKPIIAENTAKYKIDSFEFETLTLGSIPPVFQGMKVYTTDEQELIMEPSIKWAGNPNITIVVKAFGIKASVQVIDLQVSALPRITLKPLVPSFPCFAKTLVSLMEKPHVDFGLKLLGADVMAIPGLYAFVQVILILIQLTSLGTIENAPDGTPEGGGLLVIIVHEARDVEGKHHTNPYARIVFRVEERKTKHIKKNRHPRWEEEFQFVCEEPPTNDKMQIEVMSRPPSIGIHSKENLGYVVISLADVISNKRINEKYHLIDSKNGRIQLELQWRTS